MLGRWLISIRLYILFVRSIYLLRTIFIGFFEVLVNLLSENLLAFLTCEDHLAGSFQLVILGFVMAKRAIEPLSAAWSSDGDLGVEDVFAHFFD